MYQAHAFVDNSIFAEHIHVHELATSASALAARVGLAIAAVCLKCVNNAHSCCRDVLKKSCERFVVVTVKSAQRLPIGDIASRSSDPYVVLTDGVNYARTKVITRSLSPTWNEMFTFFIR
jgi:hypothetical protein